MAGKDELDRRIDNAITDRLIFEKTSVSRETLDSIRQSSKLASVQSFEDNGKRSKASNQGLSFGIGYFSGILIYILTFVYGAMVMRGVMEEKTNRIAEVVVSSVKPFQLMMGKITGIGAVGLTQFLLWIVLITGLAIVAQGFIPHDTMKEVQQLQQANTIGNGASVGRAGDAAQKIAEFKNTLDTANWALIIFCFLFYFIEFKNTLDTANWALIIFCFLFYFIGGYLFYSALFAAVGSAVNEDPQEAQSLMMPITLPVIFSFFIMTSAIQDPAGPLAVWASIIPFSSPIVMMARIPFGVPTTVEYWQLGLSMALLVAGFLGTTWLAGKIYRTGILMYGKKATWKTMWKWAFHK
jgi:ABC-2 type transport system permease protein